MSRPRPRLRQSITPPPHTHTQRSPGKCRLFRATIIFVLGWQVIHGLETIKHLNKYASILPEQ